MTTLAEAWRQAADLLRRAGNETASLDAQILLCAVIGRSRAALLSLSEDAINPNQQSKYVNLIDRRLRGEPVSRILGRREFWSLTFALGAATLDPRPDSETLIEAALALLPDRENIYRFLDLGTGTGCLLLALLHEFPRATGIGVDCSAAAVPVAEDNADRLNFANRVQFKVGNWHDDIDERFDLIIANPPYIPTADLAFLARDVRDFDPILALDGGSDGLDAYRTIFPALAMKLYPDGYAVFEIGRSQGDDVAALAEKYSLSCIGRRQDLAGTERCLIFQPSQI